MNIFCLDLEPSKAAQYHVDSHVVKMRLETCQLLVSSMHKRLGKTRKESITPEYVSSYFHNFPRKDAKGNAWPYGIGYLNHPCCKWVGEAYGNFIWLLELGFELCKEMEYRYGTKDQKCLEVLKWIDNNHYIPDNREITPFALAITDDLKITSESNSDRVSQYREYYRRDKVHLHKWTKRDRPEWL